MITEEMVFETETKFNKKIQDTFLPDAIGGQDLYVFKSIVWPLYKKLVSENRYNDEMIQKIRRDWLDYMEAMQDRSTYNYLWLETPEGEKADNYRNDHITASKKMFAIEDAFAAAIGKEAIEALDQARKLEYSALDKDGNLAPEGHEFGIGGELRLKK